MITYLTVMFVDIFLSNCQFHVWWLFFLICRSRSTWMYLHLKLVSLVISTF